MVNQLNARNTDSAGGDEFTLTYDGVGDMTDDGANYTYIADALAVCAATGSLPLLPSSVAGG